MARLHARQALAVHDGARLLEVAHGDRDLVLANGGDRGQALGDVPVGVGGADPYSTTVMRES